MLVNLSITFDGVLAFLFEFVVIIKDSEAICLEFAHS